MKRGFTLIELLVVIAIIAVLSAAAVLVLNPAELIKQGRDATRISDLATIHSALALFVGDGQTTWPAAGTICAFAGQTVKPGGGASSCTGPAVVRLTDGTGWVNVNFGLISSGSPISLLPIDPNNGGSTCLSTTPSNRCFYAFTAGTLGKYKIYANMESTKYSATGSGDVESTAKDGGTVTDWYEVGTDLSL